MRLHNPTYRRSAFTLIEMLMAIAIIAVLVVLSSASYFWVVGRQYEKNTNATIEHVYGVLKKQWNHVIAEARKESIPDMVRQRAEPDPSGDRARVMWIMLRLAEAFPQTYQEVKSPSILTITGVIPKYSATYNAKWKAAGSPTGGANLQAESSACLYLALATAKGGAALDANQMPCKAQDTDMDKLPEFCDAWGAPIAFFRFPYANASMLAKAQPLIGSKGPSNNPLDPNKTLQGTWTGTNKATFENAIAFDIGGGNGNYTVPVLVSAGKTNPNSLVAGLQFSNARGFADMLSLATVNDEANFLYSFNIVAP